MKITFTARLLIYSAVLAYVALDLFAFSGPLRKAIDRRKIDSPESIEEAKKSGTLAIVLGRPITTTQLERAVQERAWLEGKSWDQVPKTQQKLMRQACLMELIDHQLIRSKIAANKEAERATEEEVNDRLKQLLARFVSRQDMEESMKKQGIADEAELRLRVAAQIEQEKYIDRQLQPLIAVSDDEIGDFYKQHEAAFEQPAMVLVRHCFWATLGKEPDAVKTVADAAMAALVAKQKTFEQLAAEQSEDERSKKQGGSLGWISQERLPADFCLPVFAMEKNQPALIQTKLGWHLVEVLDKRDAKKRTFEESKEEIKQTLIDSKRAAALENLRQAIRRDHQLHTHIYQPVLDMLE